MDKIDKMTAQELNEAILIALGYEKLPLPAIPQWQKPGDQLFYVPQYSTSIADAWELVEQMKQIGGAVCVEWTIEFIDTPFKWWCGANVPQDYKTKTFTNKWYSGRDESAPCAICRAWLKWKLKSE